MYRYNEHTYHKFDSSSRKKSTVDTCINFRMQFENSKIESCACVISRQIVISLSFQPFSDHCAVGPYLFIMFIHTNGLSLSSISSVPDRSYLWMSCHNPFYTKILCHIHYAALNDIVTAGDPCWIVRIDPSFYNTLITKPFWKDIFHHILLLPISPVMGLHVKCTLISIGTNKQRPSSNVWYRQSYGVSLHSVSSINVFSWSFVFTDQSNILHPVLIFVKNVMRAPYRRCGAAM